MTQPKHYTVEPQEHELLRDTQKKFELAGNLSYPSSSYRGSLSSTDQV